MDDHPSRFDEQQVPTRRASTSVTDVPIDRPNPVDPAAAMRGASALFARWRIDDAEALVLLGASGPDEFAEWKSGTVEVLPEDVLRRIGCQAGILVALRTAYADHAQGDAWLRRPNRRFADRTPLDRMLDGALADVEAVHAQALVLQNPWS